MRGRSSALLIAAAALLIGLLVVVKRSLGDADEPPRAQPTTSRSSTASAIAAPEPVTPEPAAVTPATRATPSPPPAPRSTSLPPTTPSLPAVVAEYIPDKKKLPPIANKPTLRAQTAAVEPQLAECAAKAGTKITGSATLTFILAHKGDEAAIETTGVDYDATTITDEPLLECMRETARAMTFQPVPDSSAIYVTRKVDLENGKVIGNKFLDFSYSR